MNGAIDETASGALPPPLLLLGNDQEWSLRSLESILGPRGFATVRAYTGQRVLELSRSTRFDAIVLSRSLPDYSGLAVLEALRKEPTYTHGTPVVLLTTGTPTRAERLEALRAGAWEYLSEPYDVESLALKLGLFVRAKRERDRSADFGLLDELTGLYSARGLARRAREMSAEVSRRSATTSCVLLAAEAEPGIPAGIGVDIEAVVAQHVATLARDVFRASDVIARLGRSEFVLLLPDTSLEAAEAAVARLSRRLDDQPLDLAHRQAQVRLRHLVRQVSGGTATADLVSEVLAAAANLRQRHVQDPAIGSA